MNIKLVICRRGFFHISIAIILAGILAAGSFLYGKFGRNSTNPVQQPGTVNQTENLDNVSISNTISAEPTADDSKKPTSIYNNKASGLSFNYPSGFSIKENNTFVFFLKTGVSDQQVQAFLVYLRNSSVIDANSITEVSAETRLAEYKQSNKNDSQAMDYLNQNENPFGIVIKASPKSAGWDTSDPDDFFGKGFSIKFSDTVDKISYYPLRLDIYNNDQKLVLQILLSYSNFTKADLLADNVGVPTTISHGITWITKTLQGPDGATKNENSYVYVQGIGTPRKSSSNLPLVEMQNDDNDYVALLPEDSRLSFYQGDKNIVPLAKKIMESMVISSK